MTADGGSRLDRAVAAFAHWQAHGGSPRQAVAQQLDRSVPPAVRAEIAAVVYGAIRAQRRSAFALGEALDELDGDALAAAFVLAQCVASDQLDAATAAQRLRHWTPVPVPFAALADLDPDGIADPIERFAVRHALPDWLARVFLAEFGVEADRVVAALDAAPPRAIRANPLRGAGRAALARELAEAGVSTSLLRWAPEGLAVGDDAALFELDAYARGAFEQQDEGSQLVAHIVAPPPRGKVLDVCAGSGGKTLAIAAALGGRGAVVATDVHERRLDELRQRARRAGADNVRAIAIGEGDWPPAVLEFARTADRIVLDVPCSGTGSWRRRPEARHDLQPADLDGLEAAQRALLDRAAVALRPGARLVYATCSVLRRENEAQVEAVLQRCPWLELVRLAEVLGGAVAAEIADASGTFLSLRPDRHGTDGFFAAILRRRRDTTEPLSPLPGRTGGS